MDFTGMKRRELQVLCKRHGLPAGGTNADLIARLDAALSGGAGAEEEEVGGVAARKGCLKRAVGDAGEAKKVTFAVEESRGRRLRSRVVWSPVLAKTRGKHAEAGAVSAADDSISAEAGANVPVRRSRRNSLTAAEAEEIEAAVTVDRKRKRKGQEIAEDIAANAQVVATHRVTRRSSLPGNTVLLPPAAEKKRGRGKAADGKNKLAAEEQVAEAQDSSAAATVVESKRSRRKGENCEPDVQKSAKVEVSSRTTRSRSVEAVVMSPTVVEKKRRRKTGDGQPDVELPTVSEVLKKDAPVTRSLRNRVVRVNDGVVDETRTSQQLENKTQPSRPATHRHKQVESSVEEEDQEQVAAPSKRRRKTGDGQPDVELPTVSEVLKKDAPVTRSLRNRVVQVNDSVFEETRTSQQLENKTQPSRPATCRHKQVESSVEEEDQEQVAAPSKAPQSRRSGRNNSEASNANSENNKLGSALVEAKNLQVAYPLTRHNAKAQDVEKRPTVKEPVRRSTRKSVVSTMLDSEDKDLTEEKNPEAHVRRSMRRSIVPVKDIKGAGEEIQHAKGEDVVKQPTVKEPVRRSTRKSLAPAMHEKEEKNLIAEKNPVAHVRRSSRKSLVPVKDVGEDIHNTKGEDMEKQLVVKQPVRRSSRKSVLPDTLENESGFIVAETNAVAHSRRSTPKSVLPNMINMEKPDLSKMARNGKSEIGKREDEKQQIVNEPDRRSRRSVATVTIEEQNNGLHEGKISKIPMRRSTHKSVAFNVVEKGSMDNTEKVGREDSGAGTRKLKVRHQHTDRGVAVVISGNDSQAEEAVLQRATGKSSNHNLSDDNGARPGPGSEKCMSHESDGEEVMKLRNHRRSSIKISSSAKDSLNTEDFSGQKFRKQQRSQTPTEKGNTGANYGRSLRTQQASHCTTSKGRSSKRRRTTAPEEVMSAEEANDGMVIREATEDPCKVSHEYNRESSSRAREFCQVNATGGEFSSGPFLGTVTLLDEICTTQTVHKVIPGSESSEVAKESLDNSKHPQEHTDIQDDDNCLSETQNKELDQSSSVAELHNGFVVEDKTLMGEADFTVGDGDEGQSPVAGQGEVSWEANTSESGAKNLADTMSPGLHTKSLQHDIDILSKETGEASGSALPTSDNNPEIHCDVIAEESIRAADLGRCPSMDGNGNLLLTNLHSEGAADNSTLPVLNAAKGCSSDERQSSFGLEFMFTEACKESCSRNVKNTAVVVDGGNKPSTCLTPGFHVGSHCGLEDEDVQPTVFDADKKLDVDQDVTEEEVVAEQKSCDEHAGAKTDLKTKLNCEFTGLDMDSDCSIAEKNTRLVADNTDDEEATIQAQQDDVQEGDPEKPSLFSATPKCKHECGLPEETVLHSKKNKGCSSSAEQSPLGLQSLFSQESIEKSVEYDALAATVHTEIGFDELKECHVKHALEKANVSEPHGTDEGSCSVSENDDCMCTSQQGNGIEGLSKASLDEEWVCSGSFLDAKHIKEGTNSEEVACKGEGSNKLVHCDDLEPSSEKTDVNGKADNAYGVSDVVLSSTLHAPANENCDACLGSNIGLMHQGHKDQCSEDTEERFASKTWSNDIFEGATAKYIECGDVLLPAEERSLSQDDQLNSKLEGTKVVESDCNFSKDISSVLDNGSVVGIVGERTLPGSGLQKDLPMEYNLRQEHLDGPSVEIFLDGFTYGGENVSRVDTSFGLGTPSYKHDGALSEEAMRTMKKYAGTCSSNPRKLLMDLQSLSSKEKIEESVSHDGLAFPSAESPGNESIDVEQRVEVHLGSNLSQLESTDPLDELIGCSKTEVLHQGHNDRCSEDREERVASRSSTYDILEAAAAKYIESGAVMLPSEERSNLKDGELNPKQESTIVMESGLSCNTDVDNTLDVESVVDIVGQRTPSGSGLPEDYCTDHNPQQDFLDGCSVEPSLQGSTTICGKKNVSGVAGTIENPSFSLATPEGALPEEAARNLKNYTGTCLADPKHLVMELQSLFSEGSIEKSDSHDDLAFPSAESRRSERTVCHFKKPVDTLVCSEPYTYQGCRQDLSRAEEKQSCMSTSVQHNESRGFLRSSHMKDWVMSAHINLSDDAHPIERDIVVEEVLCEEKEERKSFPTSDSDILQPHSNEYGICRSYGQKCIAEIDSKQLSCDAEVLHKDHKEESKKPSEDRIIPKVLENDMSEISPIEGMESAIMLPSVAGTLEMPDEQLQIKLNDEGEEHSFSCDKGTFEIKGCHIDSCQKQQVSDVLSLPKSPGESAIRLDESVSGLGQ